MMTNIDEAVVKSKRPADSAFKQQRLAAWQPILTAGTVLPTFFVIGIAFIPVGIGLLHFSYEVREFTLDYTECRQYFVGNRSYGDERCSDVIDRNESCVCYENFTLTEEFAGKVYMYYGLSNFYQNHRRYVKSRDDNQLLGQLDQAPSKDCSPYDYTNDTSNRLPIAPCGAIANSLFNDNLTIISHVHNAQVPLLRKGIAWPSDKQIKFRNPEAPDGNLSQAFRGYAKPLRWKKPVYELDVQDPDNNGFQNEDLIVWMRTAALPEFRKLYRLVNHNVTGYVNGLPRGNYSLLVDYSYQVNSFNGTKYVILSTTSLLGGKNPFLGIAYIVVGSVCLFLGIVFLFIHVKCGKSTSEMINVNPRTPYQ